MSCSPSSSIFQGRARLCFGSYFIAISSGFLIQRNGNDLASIVDTVYPHFCELFMPRPYIKERAIVTPTNKLVSYINDHILALRPGELRKYFSLDSIVPEGNDFLEIQSVEPVEFLNTLSFNAVSDRAITLKEQILVMVLPNINPALRYVMGQGFLSLNFASMF